MRFSKETWDKIRAFEPIEPFSRYVLIASVLEVVPDIVILVTVRQVLTSVGVDVDEFRNSAPRELKFVSAVVFAPIFETFVLAGFISILSRYIRKPLAVAIVSAVCWGIVHALRSPISFFGVTVGFFVQSYSYLSWRKVSFAHAYAVAVIAHVANNAIAVALASM